MRIAIAGAGAMGSKFGWHLKRANNNVTLIDSWDKNIAAVRKNGVIAKVKDQEITEKKCQFIILKKLMSNVRMLIC